MAHTVTLVFKGLTEPVVLQNALTIRDHRGQSHDLEAVNFLKDYPYTLVIKKDNGHSYISFTSSDLLYMRID